MPHIIITEHIYRGEVSVVDGDIPQSYITQLIDDLQNGRCVHIKLRSHEETATYRSHEMDAPCEMRRITAHIELIS